MLDLDLVHEALGRVVDPCSIATGVPISLADMGMVLEVTEADGAVRVTLRLTSPICWQGANIMAKVEQVVGEVPGVTSVTCAVNARAEWLPAMMNPLAQARLRRLRPVAGAVA